jgi:transcriptional regulator with XRE-family HTH domain
MKAINMRSFDPKTLTGAQLRAARALVGISAQQLADTSGLGVATIRRAEQNDGVVTMTAANATRIVDDLEMAGVEFMPENGGGAGVRFRK